MLASLLQTQRTKRLYIGAPQIMNFIAARHIVEELLKVHGSPAAAYIAARSHIVELHEAQKLYELSVLREAKNILEKMTKTTHH